MKDMNNVTIEIGDIVKIENSPIKADNATYVVAQDGTSKNYTGKDLTLYKVAKHKGGYSLSRSSYNICFYPLCNLSNKYKYTREEMNAATIEILIKADSNKFNLVKSDDKYENEETEQTYFSAKIMKDNERIEDVSYSANEREKMIAFFSNITLKQGETIEIVKQDHSWGYYYRSVDYKLESIKPVKEVKEKVITVEPEQIIGEAIEQLEVEQGQPQEETTNTIERKYFTINEQLAKTSQSLWSFNDYKTGSATESYKKEVEKAYTLAEKVAAAKPDRLGDALSLAERFSKSYAAWINKGYSIEMMCPSVMICGAGNFPVRKKEKQNNARDKHMSNYEYITGYLKKIESILYSSEVIRSDDKNAVQKIKDKIAMLESQSDPYGNKKAEIRRLKGRLLQLSPEEVKQGKEITINGIPATFENIIKIFNESVPKKSSFSEDEERFYLNIPLVFSDGKRKYTGYVSNEVNEDSTLLSTYGNRDNNYQTIWKPLTDEMKFNLIIGQISGSGNKAVIYSILKDLLPKKEVEQQKATTELEENTPFKVVENTEIMRLQLLFDGIPEASTREVLKKNGFKWSPSNKAWQRLLNDNARYSLMRIKKELTA